MLFNQQLYLLSKIKILATWTDVLFLNLFSLEFPLTPYAAFYMNTANQSPLLSGFDSLNIHTDTQKQSPMGVINACRPPPYAITRLNGDDANDHP